MAKAYTLIAESLLQQIYVSLVPLSINRNRGDITIYIYNKHTSLVSNGSLYYASNIWSFKISLYYASNIWSFTMNRVLVILHKPDTAWTIEHTERT